MKRDMELVRKILFAIEKHPHGYAPDPLEIEGFSEEQVGHHCYLMMHAGLIEGMDTTDGDSEGPTAEPRNLTWAGHDFLGAARDESVWSQVKSKVKEKGLELGSLGFGVLIEYLKQQIKETLGMPPGS
jgi:hypothetical protein